MPTLGASLQQVWLTVNAGDDVFDGGVVNSMYSASIKIYSFISTNSNNTIGSIKKVLRNSNVHELFDF